MSIKNSLVAEKYQLLQKIGQGSFGMVYLAQDVQSNVLVAVKTETL